MLRHSLSGAKKYVKCGTRKLSSANNVFTNTNDTKAESLVAHGKLTKNIYRLRRKVDLTDTVDRQKNIALQMKVIDCEGCGDVSVVIDEKGVNKTYAQPMNGYGIIPGLTCSLVPCIPGLANAFETPLLLPTIADKVSVRAGKNAFKAEGFVITSYKMFMAPAGAVVNAKLSIVSDGKPGSVYANHVSVGPADCLVVHDVQGSDETLVRCEEMEALPFKLMDKIVFIATHTTGIEDFLRNRPPSEFRALMEAVREGEDAPRQLALICDMVRRMRDAPDHERASRQFNILLAVRDTIANYRNSFDYCVTNNQGGSVNNVDEAMLSLSQSLACADRAETSTTEVEMVNVSLLLSSTRAQLDLPGATEWQFVYVKKAALEILDNCRSVGGVTIAALCPPCVVMGGAMCIVLPQGTVGTTPVEKEIELGAEKVVVHVDPPVSAAMDDIEQLDDGTLQASMKGHIVHFDGAAFDTLNLSVEKVGEQHNGSSEQLPDVCFCRHPGCGKRTMVKYRVGDAGPKTPLCSIHAMDIVLPYVGNVDKLARE